MVVKSPLARAALFVGLAAVAVLGYLFLLSVFRGLLGPFSSALPAFALASAALYLNRPSSTGQNEMLTISSPAGIQTGTRIRKVGKADQRLCKSNRLEHGSEALEKRIRGNGNGNRFEHGFHGLVKIFCSCSRS